MPIIQSFKNKSPRISVDAFLADNAVVIGDVELGPRASVWFGSVLRGDVGPIRIGARSNIQDLCVVHTTGGLSEMELGEDVTVGHACVLHGCRVGSRALIGMGSILLDNVSVGEDSVVGAGTLLTANTVIPPRSLVLGRPGRRVREVNEVELQMGVHGAITYQELARAYREMRG